MKLSCADALTVLTGRLCVSVDRLYEIYNGLTNDNLYTHQLVRAGKTCQPYAESNLPARLVEFAMAPCNEINGGNYKDIIRKAVLVAGDSFDLEPLKDWEFKNPLAELSQMVGTERTIIINAPEPEGEDA